MNDPISEQNGEGKAGEVSTPAALANLPDKRYFTIGEVSEICDVKQHVLRYWEKVFPQLRPDRRITRRYYRREDLLVVWRIRSLLQEQGYTIKGARKILDSSKSVHVYQQDKDEPLSREQLREKLSEISKLLELTEQQLSEDK